ncbi:MAG: hypothetical protein CMM87_00400 [Rickettsiales bacterium]|nr:hypothetical protein [Rickettsiales bacterium]|tara:strand:+ start:15173 stop:16033 length:861 start_codon:yes stop_codon:yes gene_type:complete
MSHNPFSAHRVVFGAFFDSFRNIGTSIRLSLAPLALIIAMALTVAHVTDSSLAVWAFMIPLLFIMYFTFPITSIHFANNGETGNNITGHTTKGIGRYFLALLGYILIAVLALGVVAAFDFLLAKLSLNPNSFLWSLIANIFTFYVMMRIAPIQCFAIISNTSSIKYTLRHTRHRVWFIFRSQIFGVLCVLLLMALIVLPSIITLRSVISADFWATLSVQPGQPVMLHEQINMAMSVLSRDIMMNASQFLLIANVLWVVLMYMFMLFTALMINTRIAQVLKDNPSQK